MPLSDDFDQCLPITLGEEGGWSDDPLDPGGETMDGVTKRAWEAWVGHPVTEADMQALTPQTVAPFYRTQYWIPLGCAMMPVPIALSVFDFGVNSGIGRCAMELQRMVGAVPDGHIGPQTLSALSAFTKNVGINGTVKSLDSARLAFLQTLSGFVHDGRGWTARVNFITGKAISLNSA